MGAYLPGVTTGWGTDRTGEGCQGLQWVRALSKYSRGDSGARRLDESPWTLFCACFQSSASPLAKDELWGAPGPQLRGRYESARVSWRASLIFHPKNCPERKVNICYTIEGEAGPAPPGLWGWGWGGSTPSSEHIHWLWLSPMT